MSIINSIFDGLLGYEKLMLICGFILFVFALVAITLMIVQRRDFKAATALIVFAIVLMGFPGIQAIKFSNGVVELDRIRSQPEGTQDPAQKQQDQQLLVQLQRRAGDDPALQAKVADGYRAIGNVKAGYALAQSVLRQKPSPAVQKTLIPVLTARLNQVQTAAPASAAPRPVGATAPGAVAHAQPGRQAPSSVSPAQQMQIATVAQQLQNLSAPLPAASHVALARAWTAAGRPQQAQSNVDAARRIDPAIQISPALLRAAHQTHR